MDNTQALIYTITSNSHILLNKQLIYKEQTIQQWEVHIREGDKNGWYVSIEVTELPQTDQPASKPFHGLLELLNKPANWLELFFDDRWYLQRIVNKTAILTCWENVRKEITAQLGDSKEVLEMIKERESAINNLEKELPASTGHLILFNSFGRNKKIRFFTPSILSSGNELDITLSAREDAGKGGQLVYEGEGALSSLSALKKEYDRQVKSYAGDARFDYRYAMQIDYLFDNTNGMMQKAVASITEQASERYVYHHQLVFQQAEIVSTINKQPL
jgi:hypothetical protein